MQVQCWCASNDLKIADTSVPCRTGYNIGKTVHGVPDAVDGRHASQSPPLRAIKLQWHRTSKWSCHFLRLPESVLLQRRSQDPEQTTESRTWD